jgi:hypothetical protein
MKKIGTFEFTERYKDENGEYSEKYHKKKAIWGDVYNGKEGETWGIIKFNVPQDLFDVMSQAIWDYNEKVKQGDREHWIKKKRKNYDGKPEATPVVMCYIPRPIDEGELTEAMKELDGYEWSNDDETVLFSIDMTKEDFSYVVDEELIKAL